jgi:phosphopantetheine adenylyltransferase
MKTISIAEFKSLLERKDWQREQDYEILERGIRQIEEWDDENSLKRIDISYAWGWA